MNESSTSTPSATAAANPRLEKLARRIATDCRDRGMQTCRDALDRPEFRQEGGTDETLTLLAALQLREWFGINWAAAGVARELGMQLPDDSDEKVKTYERIKSELGPLVERVYDLVMESAVAGTDEELPRVLVSQGSAALTAQSGAGLPAPSLRAELTSLLAQLLHVPPCVAHVLDDHAAIDRAMELLGQPSSASAEEIERHRPQIRVDAATEAAAHRIADSARDDALERAVERIATSSPELAPAERTIEATRQVDEHPASWGPISIKTAASKLLGISLPDACFHPAVLRAEQLIPGLPSYYDVLIGDFAKSPKEAAAEITAGVQQASHTGQTSPMQHGLSGDRKGLRSDPPPFQAISFKARHLGGHPAMSPETKYRRLLITYVGSEIYADGRAGQPPLARSSTESSEACSSRAPTPWAARSRSPAPRVVFLRADARSRSSVPTSSLSPTRVPR
jgi:hypothetical protein